MIENECKTPIGCLKFIFYQTLATLLKATPLHGCLKFIFYQMLATVAKVKFLHGCVLFIFYQKLSTLLNVTLLHGCFTFIFYQKIPTLLKVTLLHWCLPFIFYQKPATLLNVTLSSFKIVQVAANHAKHLKWFARYLLSLKSEYGPRQQWQRRIYSFVKHLLWSSGGGF